MDRLLDFFNESSAGVRAVASTAFPGPAVAAVALRHTRARAIPRQLAQSRVAMAPGPSHDCWSSSNRAANGCSIRCAETTAFPRSRRLTLRACWSSVAGVGGAAAEPTAFKWRARVGVARGEVAVVRRGTVRVLLRDQQRGPW